jgi:hypothetical protein
MGTGADFLSMAQTWIGRESHHHRHAEILSRPHFPGPDFATRIARGNVDAILLAEILDSRPNEHLFAAEDRRDWDDWIDFFSRTIDPTVRKGLVEVTL